MTKRERRYHRSIKLGKDVILPSGLYARRMSVGSYIIRVKRKPNNS